MFTTAVLLTSRLPGRTDLISTRVIDGRECLVIELGANVEVNGIAVRGGMNVQNDVES